jgi:hypothetical protein
MYNMKNIILHNKELLSLHQHYYHCYSLLSKNNTKKNESSYLRVAAFSISPETAAFKLKTNCIVQYGSKFFSHFLRADMQFVLIAFPSIVCCFCCFIFIIHFRFIFSISDAINYYCYCYYYYYYTHSQYTQ